MTLVRKTLQPRFYLFLPVSTERGFTCFILYLVNRRLTYDPWLEWYTTRFAIEHSLFTDTITHVTPAVVVLDPGHIVAQVPCPCPHQLSVLDSAWDLGECVDHYK